MSYQQMNVISESNGYPVSGLAPAALLQGIDGLPHGRQWLYCLLQHFVAGRSRLPVGMGLEMALFYRLCAEAGIEPLFSEAEEEHQLLLQTLILQRQAECQELETWLQGYVRPEVREMATIIAHACMGFRHLWDGVPPAVAVVDDRLLSRVGHPESAGYALEEVLLPAAV